MKTINNRYQIISKLGQGGMGAVYEAYDRLTQSNIALKRIDLPAQNLQVSSMAASDNQAVALIQELY